MKKALIVPVVLSVLLLVSCQSFADTVTCPSIADIYIDQYAPDENMNYKTRILISRHPSKGIARGLIKFDIPEEIDDSEIASATLYLSGSYHSGGGDAIQVSCYALNETFSEASDTWTTLSGGDYDDSTSSSGSLPSGADWETSFDVTTLATGNLEKLRDYGMLIRLQSESGDNYQNIASQECVDPEDFAPYLEIDYTEIISSSTTTSEPLVTSTSSMQVSSTSSSFVSTSSTTTSIVEDTTTTSSSSTTTTGKLPLCPIETIYGEDSDEVVVLRYYRDHVLQATPEGREIIQLYYAWSPSVARMIENDLELQGDLQKTVDEFLHMVNEAQ